MPNQDATGRLISDDGLWVWDGQAWQPSSGSPTPTLTPAPPKRGFPIKRVIGGVVALLVMGSCVTAIANQPAAKPTASATSAPTAAPAPATATTAPPAKATATAAPVAKATAAPAGPTLTNQQKNAVASAKQYLSFAAFSRQGLIDQLSSSAGSGYPVQDATVAVDSLNVDWNKEAVQSAKEYLKFSPFSCTGLIEQLASSAGSQFTVDQATYGAQQAGACS